MRDDKSFDKFLELPVKMRERAFQVDTVVEIQGDFKSILAIHFPVYELQLMLLLDEHTCENVVGALDWIEGIIGTGEIARLFGIILTDRGIEFCDYKAIEKSSIEHAQRCRVFYCDPMRSNQKGSCEKNHTFIRRILPKKTSFENLTQEDVSLMCSHINSYPRKSIGGISPIAACSKFIPKKLLDELGIKHMRSDEVALKPSLLDKKII